jgi:hypothetical protein
MMLLKLRAKLDIPVEVRRVKGLLLTMLLHPSGFLNEFAYEPL